MNVDMLVYIEKWGKKDDDLIRCRKSLDKKISIVLLFKITS